MFTGVFLFILLKLIQVFEHQLIFGRFYEISLLKVICFRMVNQIAEEAIRKQLKAQS